MRGQAHTLEGVVAALLIVTSIVFALQMTSVTPLSASTSSQHIETQQRASAEGVLAHAASNGSLRRAVLFWDPAAESFHETRSERYYTQGSPPNAFGAALSQAFESQGIAFNVNVVYQAEGGNATRRQRMVYVGEPSDTAVRVTRTVVLTDTARLHDETGQPTDTRLSRDTFYAPDTAAGGIYNVLQVEVVVWRI